ncbi:hypothetical protein PUNSTDRAFT_130525 [Punctularia strigosozonata HHB-11173 SS5]|uniref:uncharacterized protein n=1 Tax=Punctularia strigosozonata (strain HHB-11173) TaxID=741275 RepID=UPI0004417DEB|nr:uncharacterized protein PUNSTDRAFT_130525 [Punctularia strigosozonata HHB-11173 SS5]EIN12258.1 hypothetical protein PUNSTDRAFT_130525 [Punctularia strigosozonata HHB-11173 SS5]
MLIRASIARVKHAKPNAGSFASPARLHQSGAIEADEAFVLAAKWKGACKACQDLRIPTSARLDVHYNIKLEDMQVGRADSGRTHCIGEAGDDEENATLISHSTNCSHCAATVTRIMKEVSRLFDYIPYRHAAHISSPQSKEKRRGERSSNPIPVDNGATRFGSKGTRDVTLVPKGSHRLPLLFSPRSGSTTVHGLLQVAVKDHDSAWYVFSSQWRQIVAHISTWQPPQNNSGPVNLFATRRTSRRARWRLATLRRYLWNAATAENLSFRG